MAKRKKKKTRADKETEAKSDKKTAKLAEKEATEQKSTEAKPKSKPKPKPKPKTKPKSKTKSTVKSRAKPKVKSNITSVIETPLDQTDKPEKISKEIDTEKPDTETITEGMEATQADVVTEELPEVAVESENLGGKAVSIQTQDKQASFVFESEDSDTAKSQGQEVGDIQADTLTDGVPEPVVDAPDATETATETEDDSQMGVESTDTEILTDDLEIPQTDNQAGEETDAVSEEVSEAVSPGGEVGSIQTEGEQTDIVVEAEDPDTAEDPVDEQTGKIADDVSEAVLEVHDTAESATETKDDFQADQQVEDSTAVDVGNIDTEIITDDLEIPQTDNQAGDEIDAVSEVVADTVSPDGEVGSIQVEDEQADIVVEAEDSDIAENLSQDTGDILTDTPADDVLEPVDEAPGVAEIATENEDVPLVGVESTDTEILADNLRTPQTDGVTEEVSEEIAEAVNSDGDEQTDIIVDSEETDTTEILSQDAVDEQTGKLADDVPESVVEAYDTTESETEEKDDFQADQQVEDSTEVDVEGTDTGTLAENSEPKHTVDQSGEVTEAILEAAAETERLTEEAEKLKAEDEQADIIFKSEATDTVESPSQEAEDIQTDDQAGEVIEAETEVDMPEEEPGSLQAEDEQTDVIVEAEDPDTVESPSPEVEDIQTDEQVDEVIEAEDKVDMPEEEVGRLQAEDEQTGVIVEAEDPDTVESPSPEAEDIQTDDQVDEVIDTEAEVVKLDDESESLPAENGQASVTVEEEDLGISEALSHVAEATDDNITDDHADEAIAATAEETVVEDSSNIKTFVDHIKKILSGLSSIGSKSDDSSEEGVENHAEAESLTGEAEDIQTDVQGEADEAVVGSRADEIQTASYSDSRRSRTKKTGIIISVLIMAAAVILLIVASIERRSAKSDLVQISKVAESIKQMQGEALKERKQIAHSQIESKELVVDALSLTRNGLELERANSDEIEVKRIIGVFINDIDERITKIKGNIELLRNKLKEAN